MDEPKISESIHRGRLDSETRESSNANEVSARLAALSGDLPLRALLDGAPTSETPLPRQIFVNRNLAMSKLEMIGFDMDYTLAIYHHRQIETLSFQMTVERLVRDLRYPEQLLALRYDPESILRGLFIDKKNGNVLKMDRFGQVDRAFHGKQRLDEETLIRLYRNERIRLKSADYAWIDTLFALPEAALYVEVVDLFETSLKLPLDYTKLFEDIREAIDTVHRDNSLKSAIRASIADYIYKDTELGPALHKLRSGGKQLFLLTNSALDYTHAVMSFLLDGALPEYASWRNYFDVVITSAQKPAFFSETNPFVELDVATQQPINHEVTGFERGHIYQGGNLTQFERFSGFTGERVLYVGDHIYGDILKSKKTSMWRTCMVVQELEDEIRYLQSRQREVEQLAELETLQLRLDDEVARRKSKLNQLERAGAKDIKHSADERFRETKLELDRLRRALKEATALSAAVGTELERGFNSLWGLHFKAGSENSRFGEQIEQYACLYTSRVSNFLFYSPVHVHRSLRELMPHEQAGTLSAKLGRLGTEGLPKASNRALTDIP
jgi:5'-nucleotidase